MPTQAARITAVSDLVGAICYALLQTFEAAARGATAAPTVALAERQAGFASDEMERFKVLRARLSRLTTDTQGAMDAFRGPLDAFYGSTRLDGWLETQVFHFVGDTITTDFAEALAPRLDPETGEAVRRALTGRTAQEGFALEQIQAALDTESDAAQARVARVAGEIVGRALTGLRQALLENDSLEVLLGPGGVKELALELLGRHRERLERLGLDTLDD